VLCRTYVFTAKHSCIPLYQISAKLTKLGMIEAPG